jgi:hypothetical protein
VVVGLTNDAAPEAVAWCDEVTMTRMAPPR